MRDARAGGPDARPAAGGPAGGGDHIRALSLLGALFASLLAGCGDRFVPGVDDDDSALACEAEALTTTLSGAVEATLEFGLPECTTSAALAQSVWTTEAGDELLLEVTDPVTGDLQTTTVAARLTVDGARYDAGPATAEFSSLDPVCGQWTVNAFTDEDGAFVTVSPQPLDVVCED